MNAIIQDVRGVQCTNFREVIFMTIEIKKIHNFFRNHNVSKR